MTLICDCCGGIFPAEIFYVDRRFRICESCYHRSYTRCSFCKALLHTEDTYHENGCVYCFSCYSVMFRYIHPHDYKPSAVFYGGIPRYFGVELEIDFGGHNDRNAQLLLESVNKDAEFIYIKTDHSLCDGLEIVSHPMTLDYHMHCFDWKSLMNTAAALGYHADDATTCGLHIHTNRSGLGNTPELQHFAILQIVSFMRKYHSQLVAVSGRNPNSVVTNAWTYPLPDNINTFRNSVISLTNQKTVEFRLFQSTLHTDILFAALRLVNVICELAKDGMLSTISWPDFSIYTQK